MLVTPFQGALSEASPGMAAGKGQSRLAHSHTAPSSPPSSGHQAQAAGSWSDQRQRSGASSRTASPPSRRPLSPASGVGATRARK